MTAIGFIGAGRVARGLAPALHEAGYHVTAIANRSPVAANDLAMELPGCEAVAAQDVADHCDLVFLTVPDDSIALVAAGLRWRAGQAVVHCSGATEVSVLAPVAEIGGMTGGFHPLQGFSDRTPLRGCTVTVEASGPLAQTLDTMVDALGCRLNRLPPGKRALYHASAGYGAGFVHVLLAEIATIWGSWGASEEDVLAAILPMTRTTLDTIGRGGIATTMPGPISRGDIGSIRAHLTALTAMPEAEAEAFYRAHSLRSTNIAESTGRIDAATATELRTMLTSPDTGEGAEQQHVRIGVPSTER